MPPLWIKKLTLKRVWFGAGTLIIIGGELNNNTHYANYSKTIKQIKYIFLKIYNYIEKEKDLIA